MVAPKLAFRLSSKDYKSKKVAQMTLNNLIVEYHKLYALYKRPEYLEIAANIGKTKPDTFQEEWGKKVNAGCVREGLPPMYPVGDNTLSQVKGV